MKVRKAKSGKKEGKVYVNVAQHINDMLDHIAETEGRSKGELIRQAIAEFVKRWQEKQNG